MTIPRNRPATVVAVPIVQWASGKTNARLAPAARFQPLVGFHVEAGRHETLDAALHAAGVARITIRHQRPAGQQPALVEHWFLGEQLGLFPVTAGPVAPTVAGSMGRNAAATAEAGLGLRWGQGEKSRLAVRGFVPQLNDADGAPILVQLATRSTMTDHLLAALLDHVRVCEALDGIIDRERHPEIVALHEVVLPLGPGEETNAGRNETTAITPLKSLHAAEITRDYPRGRWRAEAVHSAACAAWGDVQHWAAEYATEGDVGDEGQGGGGFGR